MPRLWLCQADRRDDLGHPNGGHRAGHEAPAGAFRGHRRGPLAPGLYVRHVPAGDLVACVIDLAVVDRVLQDGAGRHAPPFGGGDEDRRAVGVVDPELEQQLGRPVPAVAQDGADHVLALAQIGGDVVRRREHTMVVRRWGGIQHVIAHDVAVEVEFVVPQACDVGASPCDGLVDQETASGIERPTTRPAGIAQPLGLPVFGRHQAHLEPSRLAHRARRA